MRADEADETEEGYNAKNLSNCLDHGDDVDDAFLGLFRWCGSCRIGP